MEVNGGLALTIDVTNAVPGARGTHIHVGTSCAVGAPGAHFNLDTTNRNAEFANTPVDDAGVGHNVSTKTGTPALTLDVAADGGPGVVGRVLAIHGAPVLLPDGGPELSEAGTPLPPPISGCGVITAN